MKKFVATISFLSLFGVSYSQDFGASLLVGANFSQIDGDQFAGYNKLGLNVGIEIDRALNPDWEAAFELKFSMKGSKKIVDPDIIDPTLKISYNYIEVPLLAKFTRFESITPYSGVSIGVNVFNERDDNGIITEEDKLKSTEIGFILGATYNFTDEWGVDLRHSYSLLSIRDYPIIVNSPTWFGRAGWYNRLFTVGLKYQFN
ncbi:MAG: porin family protein [Bacteroidia bacterium]|nr:porin family protein [Bacteroidia bacterium]